MYIYVDKVDKNSRRTNKGKMSHQNMAHFVDKHLLIPLNLDAGERLYCKACELLIVEPFHGCLACKNYFHHHCLNISRSILHPSHPSHPLTLLPAPTYPYSVFGCDACGITGRGFTYSCAHCEVDLHLKCATLPKKLKLVDKHPHDLKLEFKFDIDGGFFKCDVCGVAVAKDLWRYYCGDCDFGVHVGCVKEVTQGLFYPVAEGKSGTATFSTQPSNGGGQVAAVDGGGGGTSRLSTQPPSGGGELVAVGGGGGGGGTSRLSTRSPSGGSQVLAVGGGGGRLMANIKLLFKLLCQFAAAGLRHWVVEELLNWIPN